MGSSATKPVPLAPAFQRMSTWEFKSAKRLLSGYKDKDLDFGLDAQGLSELVHGDKTWASEIIDAFGSTNGMGFCVLSGVGTVPSDEDLEAITLQAYRELNKSSGQSISKSEFTKWALRFAAGSTGGAATMTAMHADVSLDDALEQFGILKVLSKEGAPHVGGDLASEATSSIDVNNSEDTSHNKDRDDVQDLIGEVEAPDEVEYRFYEEDAEPKENDVAHAQVKPATPQPDEQQDETFERADEMAVQQDVCHQKEAELYEAQPSSANEYAEQDEEQEYEQEFAAETPRSARVEEGGEPSLDSNAVQGRQGTEDGELFEAEAMNRYQDSPPQDDAGLLASERDEPNEVAAVGEGMTTSVSPPLEPEVQGLDATASYGVDTEEPAADASQPEEQESVGSTQREEQQLVDMSQVKVSDAVDISQPEVPGLEDASQLEVAAPGPHATPDSPITPEGLEGSERESGKDEPLNDVSQKLPNGILPDTGVVQEPIVNTEHELAHDSAESPTTESAAPTITVSDAADPASDAVVDLNDFDAYDYTQAEFDASSGLPPPEERDFGAAEENSDATSLATLSVSAESASIEERPGVESTNTITNITPVEFVAPTKSAEEQ